MLASVHDIVLRVCQELLLIGENVLFAISTIPKLGSLIA